MKLDLDIEATPVVKKYYDNMVAEVEKQLAVAEKAKDR